MEPTETELTAALRKLDAAIAANRSNGHCLSLWSRFIRLRDGGQCVVCREEGNLFAHHIVRKSFLPEARFMTGNGISLCRSCHKEPHEAFNQRPDLDLPMDAEGGENLELLTALFGALAADAKERKLLNDRYYHLSDDVLKRFKAFQGIDPDLTFPGSELEQACLIWKQTPRGMLGAMLQLYGIELPTDFIQTGPYMVFVDD